MLIYIIKLWSLIIKHPSYKSICTVSQQFMEMHFFVFVLNITCINSHSMKINNRQEIKQEFQARMK